MPNWCSTEITFYSKEKKSVEKLEQLLNELKNNPSRLENGFGSLWLGNVLDAHGIKWEDFHCRGSIVNLGDVEPDFDRLWTLRISQEDAWAPNVDMWEAILEQYDDLHFAYSAFEPEMGLYMTSDEEGRFYPERFIVDAYLEKPDGCIDYYESFEDEEQLIENLNSLAGAHSFTSAQEACSYFRELIDSRDNGDEYFTLYQCEVCTE